MNRKAFTLVELITVVVIIGIGIGFFYATFLNNWRALEDQDAQRNLWQDMNLISETITADARRANAVLVAANGLSAQFIFPASSGLVNVTYSINGLNLLKIQGASNVILSRNVELDPPAPAPDSLFVGTSNALRLDLTLSDSQNIFGPAVRVTSSIFISPRCASCI